MRVQAIDVMGDLYASAIGTTVLQLKEIAERPVEYDGALCLFLLRDSNWVPQDVDEAAIRAALSKYGEITRCELTGPLRDNQGAVLVRFATHEAARAAKRAGKVEGVCAGVDTLFNERSYDGRKGEAGREDDDGRGWCAHARFGAAPRLLLMLPRSEPRFTRSLLA